MGSAKKRSVAETQPPILSIRGQKVILDAELAGLYGVPTKALNQAVKRNLERFPDDFVFQLGAAEVTSSRSQNVTSNNRSQAVRGSGRGGTRYRPYAFTEHGAVMAAMVLNSPKAVEMSVFVVRAFVKMREHLTATAVLAKRLAELEKTLLIHNSALRDIYQKLKPLLLPPEPPKKKGIGFHVKEKRDAYRTGKKK